MIVYKEPKFENDSYMFVLNIEDELTSIDHSDNDFMIAYKEEKYIAFSKKGINKERLKDFKCLPSLGNFDNISDLAGTIYTHTCEGKNKLDYNHIIKFCKKFHKTSRRCAVNFADTLSDYLNPNKNTSCLNSIHYCGDNVTLYFRASDIKNELLLDLHLIIDFFIKPVGNFKTITVIASTAQNVETKLSTLIQ